MKIVYNSCYGRFGLSKKALELYNQKRTSSNLSIVECERLIDRHDLLLVEVVEELKEEANSRCAKLEIEEIPIEYANCYTIEEYDGLERVECDPCKLVEFRLKDLKVVDLTDQECRMILQEMVDILSK